MTLSVRKYVLGSKDTYLKGVYIKHYTQICSIVNTAYPYVFFGVVSTEMKHSLIAIVRNFRKICMGIDILY